MSSFCFAFAAVAAFVEVLDGGGFVDLVKVATLRRVVRGGGIGEHERGKERVGGKATTNVILVKSSAVDKSIQQKSRQTVSLLLFIVWFDWVRAFVGLCQVVRRSLWYGDRGEESNGCEIDENSKTVEFHPKISNCLNSKEANSQIGSLFVFVVVFLFFFLKKCCVSPSLSLARE